MKSLYEIQQAWDNKEYLTKIPRPTKELFVENLDEKVRESYERKEKIEKDYKAKLDERELNQNMLMEKLREECIAAETDYGLSKEQVSVIWGNAYDEKHSCMSDVFGYFENQCELVRNVLKVKAVVETEEPKKECECLYSRSMNQVYPRHCVRCGKPETIQRESNRGKQNYNSQARDTN